MQQEQRLLYTMANAHYTYEVVCPALARQYDDLKLELTALFDTTSLQLGELQRSCMDALVRLKSEAMVDLLHEAVPLGLDTLPKELEPRMYVKQVLRDMVLLHSSVSGAARGFTGRALYAVANRVAEAMAEGLKTVALQSDVVRRQVSLLLRRVRGKVEKRGFCGVIVSGNVRDLRVLQLRELPRSSFSPFRPFYCSFRLACRSVYFFRPLILLLIPSRVSAHACFVFHPPLILLPIWSPDRSAAAAGGTCVLECSRAV